MANQAQAVLTRTDSAKATEKAICTAKSLFEHKLGSKLNLMKVSAPLFVAGSTGINDNLNGWERSVSFDAAGCKDMSLEVVQSLAKWKRLAARYYGLQPGEGLYADMRAIRRDEELGPLHSLLVDQWDWELVITKQQRSMDTLKDKVQLIYAALKETESELAALDPLLPPFLPEDISFVTSQELEDRFGAETAPKEREQLIAREKGAVFLMQVGGRLASGQPHDGRAPDYDDWQLNGDIIVWNPVLEMAFEISSMGIRVDEESLVRQLQESGCAERAELPFHQMLLGGELPYTIGGGIGQSRVAMLLLRKSHIGQVQMSVWPQDMMNACRDQQIELLNVMA
ncbi:aspartate--ammonia ligase [Paenibacillus tarimensis]|uniref:aspartate--ammonia ligase n=1 Tax=Paenibacillus tarimensis TaxID=416012 RepID=UPI001F38A78A|nr:aspartate--ammonia ligase [Paenibacillus tarimensis]MCF2945807.1 aspartate--ammonia ligase [Paenibacillus tarimensis]